MDAFDLASIFALRSILSDLERSRRPDLRTITPVPACRAVALLPGAFDPPTAAHQHLAERALGEGYDKVVFTLPVRTVGKRFSGLTREDRLLALRAMSTRDLVVAASSHGLYADQAEAAARVFPGAEVAFLVGSDKVLQIFDPRWYADRERALGRLFDAARLVVAPRADHTKALREVLVAPENRRFAERVEILRLHPAVGDLSSTRVRGLLRAGARPAGLVPHAVASLLEEIRAYAPAVMVGAEEVDAYALRRGLIELLWKEREHPAGALPDLRRLMTIALSSSEAGRSLRAMVRDRAAAPALLRAAAGA